MKEYNVSTFEIFLMETPNDLLPEVLIKLKKNAISRKSYYKNWEKEIERNRKYYENNAERERERSRKWKEENPEKSSKIQREKDPQRFRDNEKRLREAKPELYRKNDLKKAWKRNGLNMENFEEIYEIYMITTHCDICEVELTDGKKFTKTTKCMDHSHITGEFRNVLCMSCNSSLPVGT